MRIDRLAIGAVLAVMMTAGTAVAGLIEKPPDLGAFWQPLNSDSGSYVYANSFVADVTGTVDRLGTWLLSLDGAGQAGEIAFEVYGSIGGDPALGPDTSNVRATTGLLDLGGGTASLDLYLDTPISSQTLTAGQTYWFGANVIGGASGRGSWQVGGHTQNSRYNDNGTFWFSNDPTGVEFDGQNATPEMAFSVNIVPTPGVLALLGLGGLAGMGRRRRG